MATKSLFAKAKASAPAKTVKAKDEKFRVKVKDSDFFEKIQRLQDLQDSMKRDKAEADMISDEIKEIGKTEWSKVYDRSKKNPGSIMLESKSGLNTAQFMFVPSDKYISINEDRSQALVKTFGEDVVEEKTVFSFDSEMVDKYGEILSEMIENCDEISEGDKEKIVKASVSYSISKGSIDKLKDYGDGAEMEVLEVFEELKPVISIKNVEVIKG